MPKRFHFSERQIKPMTDPYVKKLRLAIAERREAVDELIVTLRDKQPDVIDTLVELREVFDTKTKMKDVTLIKVALSITASLILISRHKKLLHDLEHMPGQVPPEPPEEQVDEELRGEEY